MEEVKAYIESGVLELYVLGHLTAEEQLEVEAMAAKYPEVKKEIDAIEFAMEEYAMQNAISPSPGLDQKIFSAIEDLRTQEEEASAAKAPQVPEQKIIQLDTSDYDSRIRSLRLALTACAVLLVVSLGFLYSAHHKLDLAQDQIVSLSNQTQKYAATVSYMKSTNTDLQKIADMNGDPTWKVVKLAGTKMDPAAKMIVYWHPNGKHVMVDNSKMALPANDQSHQYQLWALVNGKPVDLGVFDVHTDTTHILVNMKEIGSAQAFAVTLEKRGGSINPTMAQMIVMGGVSI